ncbi:MAG: hypothetical protein GX842_00640 [Spirochaetales bacterium]|nr:hypothetical protein [Spirochaetales bacterium]
MRRKKVAKTSPLILRLVFFVEKKISCEIVAERKIGIKEPTTPNRRRANEKPLK